MNKFKTNVDPFELNNLIEKMFGRRSVKLIYSWNSGGFQLKVDGVVIEHDLEEIIDLIKRYNVSGINQEYKSYEELIKIIESELL